VAHSSASLSLGPSRTLLQLFADQVRRRPEAIALRHKRGTTWETTTWRAWDEEARAFAAGLIARGLEAKDRVALIARTRREALVADVGILLAGGIPVPVYPTLTPDQLAFIVRDAGAKIVIADDAPALARLGPTEATTMSLGELPAILQEGRAALGANGDLVDRRARAVTTGDTAAIFYTSGTTGEPKGVVLTHASFVFEVDAAFPLFGLTAKDEQLLFLPLAHIFAKVLVVAAMRSGAITAIASSMLTALDECEEVRPTFFGSVPRLFEKLHEVALAKVREAGRAQEKIFAWAMEIGHDVHAKKRAGRPIPLVLELQHRYADKLVFSKLRARFGGRLRFALSGAAPIDRALCEWYAAAGVLVFEGYGLTETTAATNLNHPQAYRFGTVGRALPGVEVRIGDDGEVLVRGPNVMAGYHGHPKTREAVSGVDTGEAIDGDGWFHTGDIGTLDDDGFLTITDRKKDLLVTAGGKNVAPQRVESMLLRSPLVARAIVLGDARPYVVALLVPDADALRALPDDDFALAGLDARALSRDGRVRAHLQRVVDEVNARLASFETIKRFAVLERDLAVDEGELTPTLKIRRRIVERNHRAAIERLYGG
jgi:long-chain acyl-CoA synthetase